MNDLILHMASNIIKNYINDKFIDFISLTQDILHNPAILMLWPQRKQL